MCGGGGSSSQTVSAGPYERELVAMAERRLGEYNSLYVPLENQFLQDTQTMGSDAFKTNMANTAISTARSQINPFQVNAGGGETQSTNQYAGGSQVLAKAAAMAGGDGVQAGEELYTGRMLEYTGVGRGQTGMAMNQFGQSAGNEAGFNAAKTQSNQLVDSSKYNAFGTAAGMGFGAAAKKYNWFED